MFSFSDELKWYEPGLETIEDSLSGDEQKDLITLVQELMKAKPNVLLEREESPSEEGTQLAIEDALEGPKPLDSPRDDGSREDPS